MTSPGFLARASVTSPDRREQSSLAAFPTAPSTKLLLFVQFRPNFRQTTVNMEKRFLLVFWSEVDTWTSTCTDIDGIFYYEMPFDGKGTYYRATFTLEVTGTNGTVDVITDTIECPV